MGGARGHDPRADRRPVRVGQRSAHADPSSCVPKGGKPRDPGILVARAHAAHGIRIRRTPVLPILVDASASQWLGADSTERREAVAALVDQMRTWGEPWAWETELFAFDRDTRPLDTWNPEGKRTNLGGALQTMKDRYVHRNVPAMVLVTDGRANRGPNPEFGVDLLDVPLFVVGTGDTSAIKDVELTRVRLNDVAYLGNGFPVEVTVRSRDMVDVPLTLSVTVDGARVTVKDATWTPSKAMDSHAWSLQLSSDRPGPLEHSGFCLKRWKRSEASLENNARTETIDILESRRRVLFLARAPHPDLAALRAAAETNRHQQTEVVWMEDLANGMVLPSTTWWSFITWNPPSCPAVL